MSRTTILGLLVFLSLLVTGTHAIAAGTTAGDDISNQATLDYKVSNVDQTQIVSDDPTVGGTTDATVFRVDRKIDLTVAFIANQPVAPGETSAAMRYSVTNTSNGTLDFKLSAEDIFGDGFAGATISSSLVEIVVDDGDNIYNAADTATFIDNLAADTSVDVWIVVNIPAGATDTLTDTWALLAQATDDGSVATPTILTNSGSNTISSEDTVLADAAGTYTGDIAQDAGHSANSDFVVSTTTLSVSKSTQVIDDGIDTDGDGDTANDAVEYAVPGAIMEYTITVNNTGSIDATALTLNDDLDNEITTQASIAWVINSITLNLNGAGAAGLSDDTDGDAGEFQGNNVKVTIATLPAGENAVIKFRVTISTL